MIASPQLPSDVPTTSTTPSEVESIINDIPETVIAATGKWKGLNLRELWQFRDLFLLLCWRDISIRYKQTAMGVAWAVLRPTLLMVLFTAFLGNIAGASSGSIPYALFTYSGMLLWILFSSIISNAAESVVGAERVITKVYFPRLIIPLAAAAPAIVDFVVGALLLVLLMMYYGVYPDVQILLVILPIAVATVLAVAIGGLLAALNVMYRDVRYAVPFLVQAGLFATPAIYLNPDLIVEPQPSGANTIVVAQPEKISWRRLLVAANPVNSIIEFFRASLFGTRLPWNRFAFAVVAVAVLLPITAITFRRFEGSFADNI